MKFTASVTLFALISVQALAQVGGAEPQSSSDTKEQNKTLSFGARAGVSAALAMGEFRTTCNCIYEEGSGVGPFAGLTAEYVLDSEWSIVLTAAWSALNPTYTVETTQKEFVQSGEAIDVTTERKADVKLTYASLIVAGKWSTGVGGLFVTAGPSFGILLNDHIDEVERKKTPGYIFLNTNTNEKRIQEGSLDALFTKSTMRFAVHAGVGYDLTLEPLTLSPMIAYEFPFTSIVKEQSRWKLASLQGWIEVKIALW